MNQVLTITVAGTVVLALIGIAGEVYWWYKYKEAKKNYYEVSDQVRNSKFDAETAQQEAEALSNEVAILKQQIELAKKETSQAQIERDEARQLAIGFQQQVKSALDERDRAQTAADAIANLPAKSPRVVMGDATKSIIKEIDKSIAQMRNLTLTDRTTEMRTLKRTYHPDAQRAKNPAVQQLFTQLFQHVNTYCEAHLQRGCKICKS